MHLVNSVQCAPNAMADKNREKAEASALPSHDTSERCKAYLERH
jgi:hypothetical protein